MVKIKKGDFVKIKYVGRLKDDNYIFDLNDEEVAKKENIYNDKVEYKPFTVCVGQKDVVKGLDEALVGKEPKEKFSVELQPEDAFGKKDPKFMQLVSAKKFKEKNMRPYPGMPITINNTPGIVKTVSGGRIMVDFNHPLASREVKYDVEILEVVTDDAEKVKAIAEMHLGMKNPKVTVEGNVAKIDNEFPEQLHVPVGKSIIERVPTLKKVEFKKVK
ncbi:MAG: peptidylprolyl isomerase [archaeon]